MDFFNCRSFFMHLFKISLTLFLAAGVLQAQADNYYEVLGVHAEDSAEKIKNSYEKKIKDLESRKSSRNSNEINSQIIKVNTAYDVLSDPESRTLYNEFLRFKNLNFYERLGLSSSASVEEIKRSYRKLAMKFHPDRFNTNERAASAANEVFREILTAYDTLNHPGKKSAYDAWLAKGGGGSYGEGEHSSFRDFSRGWSSNQNNQKIFSEFLYKETPIGTLEGRVKILVFSEGETSITSKEIKGTFWNIPNGQGGYEIVLTRESDNRHFRFKEAGGLLYMESVEEIIPKGGQRPLLSLILRQNFEHHVEFIQRIESIDGVRSDGSRVKVQFDVGEGAGPRSQEGFNLGTGVLKSLKVEHPDGKIQKTEYDIDGDETRRKNYTKNTDTSSQPKKTTSTAEEKKEEPRSSRGAVSAEELSPREVSSSREVQLRGGSSESSSRAVYSPGSLDWQKVDQLLFRNMTVHPQKHQEGIMMQIRNLPATTLMFYAAMGASMYLLPSVTSHVVNDGLAHSPTGLSDFTEMVSTPMGLISFAAFVVVSGGVGLGISKASRFYNSYFEKNALQSRQRLKTMNTAGMNLGSSMEPDLKKLEAHRRAVIRNVKGLSLMRLPLALSAGLIASSIVYEFGADPNVKICKDGMRDKENRLVNDWLTACDKAYSDWAVSKKLKQWGPGLAALVGVAAGMHYAGSKIKPRMVQAVENTKKGKSGFSRFTGFVMKHQGKRWFNTLVLRTPATVFGAASLTALLYILHEVDPVIQKWIQPGKSADETAKKRWDIDFYKDALDFDKAIPDQCLFMTKICEHSNEEGQCDSDSISAENSAMRSYVASSPDNSFSLMSFAAGVFSYDNELAQCPNRTLIKSIDDHSGIASSWRVFSLQKFHQSYNGWMKKSFQAHNQYALAYDFFKMLKDTDNKGKILKTAHPLSGIHSFDTEEKSLDGVREAVGKAIDQINVFINESSAEEAQSFETPKNLISAHPDEYLIQNIQLPLGNHRSVLKTIEGLLSAVYCENPIENYYSQIQQNRNLITENSENLSSEELKCLSEEPLRIKAVAAGVELLNKAFKQAQGAAKAASFSTIDISLPALVSEWFWPAGDSMAKAEEQLGTLRAVLGGDPHPHSRGMKFIYEQAEARKLLSNSSFSFYNPLIDVSPQSQDPYKEILHNMVCGKDLNSFDPSAVRGEIKQNIENSESQEMDMWMENLPLFEKGVMGHYSFSVPKLVQDNSFLPEGFCGLSANQAFKVKITANGETYTNLLHYVLAHQDKGKDLNWWAEKVQSQFRIFHVLTQQSFGRMLKYYLKPAIIDNRTALGSYDPSGGFIDTAGAEDIYSYNMPRGILNNIEDELYYLTDLLENIYEMNNVSLSVNQQAGQKVKRAAGGISIIADKKDVIQFIRSYLLERFTEKSQETKRIITEMIDLEQSIKEEIEILRPSPLLISESSKEEETAGEVGLILNADNKINTALLDFAQSKGLPLNENGELEVKGAGIQKVIEIVSEEKAKAYLSFMREKLPVLPQAQREDVEKDIKFNYSLIESFKFLASSADLTPEEYAARDWKVLSCLTESEYCNPTASQEEGLENLFSLKDHALIAVFSRFQKIFQELQSYLDQTTLFSSIYLQSEREI